MDFGMFRAMLQLKVTGQDKRYQRLNMLEMVLKGTQYDSMTTPFYSDNTADVTAYTPLRKRRPSVKYNLAKIIVDRSNDMLFGDAHWPSVHIDNTEDKDTEAAINTLLGLASFKKHWRKACKMGSVGSVVVIFKIIDKKLYHEVINAKDCTPYYHPRIPGEIIKIRELKVVCGEDLKPLGYTNLDDDAKYLYRRDFTENEEIEYFPIEQSAVTSLDPDKARWVRNDERSFTHNLGFVPGVWIRNLESDDPIDGECTFEHILDLQLELDYQLSQIGRVFHYTGDPLLVLKDPSLLDPEDDGSAKIRSAGNAIILNENGDAKNLEIQAEAQVAAMKYIEMLRNLALEVARGNRASADKLTTANSAKALALLHKDIIGLVSDLRISYGDEGLIPYLQKILRASQTIELDYEGFDKKINPDAIITLRWGAFFEPTSEDDRSLFEALKEGVQNEIISRHTGTKIVAPRFDISDAEQEAAQAKQEAQERLMMAAKLGQSQQASQKIKSEHL